METRMRVKVLLTLAIGAAVISGVALGQGDPIAERQALMKANNAASRTAFGMAMGKTPFDATVAAAAMQTLADDMAKFVTLFPEGSDTGDTSASPDIWTNFEDFKAISAKLEADAKAAGAAAANGLEAFKVALGPVGEACSTCHKKYRTD